MTDDLLQNRGREIAREPALLPLFLDIIPEDDDAVPHDQGRGRRDDLEPQAPEEEGTGAEKAVRGRQAGDQPKGLERPEAEADERGSGSSNAYQEEMNGARRMRDRVTLEQGLEEIRLDLHPRHPLLAGEGGGEEVLEAGRHPANQHDLAGEPLRPDLTAHDLIIRDYGKGPGRATEVDQHRLPRPPRLRRPRHEAGEPVCE